MKKIIRSRADYSTRDPFIIKHNGMYYQCFTKNADAIYIACAKTTDELEFAEAKCVYVPNQNILECAKELWAPELHVINGKCYIYVACDDGNNNNHRMFVLKNNSNNPLDPYTLQGKICDKTNKWAIDATVVLIGETNYFVWSGWEGEENVCQNLYIAKMENPYTLTSERVLISTPEFEWEKRGASGKTDSPFINEGPFGVYVDGEFYLLYSAAGSWCEDYCISALKLVGKDPISKESWQKQPLPIFSNNNLVKGAGHCSVVCEESQNLLFFHAWDKDEEKIRWDTVSVWEANLTKEQGKLVIK